MHSAPCGCRRTPLPASPAGFEPPAPSGSGSVGPVSSNRTAPKRTSPLGSLTSFLLVFLFSLVMLADTCSAAGTKAPAAPKASYKSKVSNQVQTLRLKAKPGSLIYYTTDGSTPKRGAQGTRQYRGKITVNRNMTVKYCAYSKQKMSSVKTLRFVYLRPVSIRKAPYRGGAITLSWQQNDKADGYIVYRKQKNQRNKYEKKWQKLTTLRGWKKNSYSDRSLIKNADYQYCVSAFKGKTRSALPKSGKKATTRHTHQFELESVDCAGGIGYYRCAYCNLSQTKEREKGVHEVVTQTEGEFTIERCRWCGTLVDKYLDKSIPSYWNDEIVSGLEAAQSRSGLPGYVFLTDPHWSKGAQNSPAIASYLAKRMEMPFAVCDGDVLSGNKPVQADAKDEIQGFFSNFTVPVLSGYGNHDNNNEQDVNASEQLTTAELSALFHSHAPANAHIALDGRFAYCDDTHYKVRYIAFHFDEHHPITDDVMDCITSRVCELDESWDVVLFSHAYWHYATSGLDVPVREYGRTLAERLLALQGESRATIALWHVGHCHRDLNQMLCDEQGNTLLAVSTNCDCFRRSASYGGLTMKKGTSTEHVLEIVQIDKQSRMIYLTRIGAGSSRSFSYQPPLAVAAQEAPSESDDPSDVSDSPDSVPEESCPTEPGVPDTDAPEATDPVESPAASSEADAEEARPASEDGSGDVSGSESDSDWPDAADRSAPSEGVRSDDLPEAMESASSQAAPPPDDGGVDG